MSERTLDAAELARLRKKIATSLLDALEKARGETEELVQSITEQTEACSRLIKAADAVKKAAIAFKAERDAARALLREVTAVAFPGACDCDECLSNDGLRARIAVELGEG